MTEITDTKLATVATLRYVNASAIHTHALKCSKQLRAGKFTRVSQSFVDDVQAEAERLIREIKSQYQPASQALVAVDEGSLFVTGAYMENAKEILNAVVARVVQAKVQRHPSVGKTLQA
jgi:hypothetical protein